MLLKYQIPTIEDAKNDWLDSHIVAFYYRAPGDIYPSISEERVSCYNYTVIYNKSYCIYINLFRYEKHYINDHYGERKEIRYYHICG